MQLTGEIHFTSSFLWSGRCDNNAVWNTSMLRVKHVGSPLKYEVPSQINTIFFGTLRFRRQNFLSSHWFLFGV